MSFNPWILTFYLIVTSNSQSWLLDVIHVIFHVIIIPFYLIIITFYLIIVTVYHVIVLFSILCHFLSNTFDSHLIIMTFSHNDTRMFFFNKLGFVLFGFVRVHSPPPCQCDGSGSSSRPSSMLPCGAWGLQPRWPHSSRGRSVRNVTNRWQLGEKKKAGFLTLTHTSRRRREIMLGIQNPHLSPDNTATHSRRSHSSHGGALFSLFQVTCNVPKMRQAC